MPKPIYWIISAKRALSRPNEIFMSVRKIRNSWWADFRFDGLRYRKKSPVNSKGGAKDYESLLRQKLVRGEPIDETKKEANSDFQQFAWNWFDVYVKNNNKHSEIVSKESILRSHLIPFFGSLRLEKIESKRVEEYKRKTAKTGLCNKTINNHLTVLRKCLNTAQEWGALKNVPVVKLLKVQPQKYDYLTEAESEVLINEARGVIQEMIRLALKTGLRFGEIIALDWQDVDLERKMLAVNKSISKGVMGSTKSNKARYIPLSSDICEMLRGKGGKFGFVFIKATGEAIKQVPCCKALWGACKRAGIRKIGWHALRHTFASRLAQKGVSLKAIQELLGHSDIKTTMRYAHLSPTELRSAIDVLEPTENFGQPAGNGAILRLEFPNLRTKNNIDFLPANKQKTEAEASAFCTD